MDILALIISGISAAAAVASAINAFKANNKVNALSSQINTLQQSLLSNSGDIKISNDGRNTGTIGGIISGSPK